MIPVAILAGGLATRLGPVTATVPKALVEVAGRPFAEHQIEWLAGQGVGRVVFLVAHCGELIRRTLGDGSRWGLSLEYLFDGPRLLGTGGAIKRAAPLLGDSFFVMYGDSYLDCHLSDVENRFVASGAAGLMTVFRNQNRWDGSNVLFENGTIVCYDKHARTPQMQHIDYGLGVLAAAALDGYPADQPFDLSAAYQDLLARGQLVAYEVSSRFYEIGSPQSLAETRAFLANRSPRDEGP